MTLSIQTDHMMKISCVQHAFFTRMGGVSKYPYESLNCAMSSFDDSANVQENRTRVAACFGRSLDDLMLCKQTHSIEVKEVSFPFAEMMRPEADAMVTQRTGVVLGILTADCAPVLLADPDARVIGAVHAGWRGALDGIIDRTVSAMEHLGAEAPRMVAAIGPCIWQDSYEVGPDFPIPFYVEDEENIRFFKPAPKRGHSLFDLPGFVEKQLRRSGIRTIDVSPADTYAQESRFYSYRRGFVRDQKEDGRMLSCIMLAD